MLCPPCPHGQGQPASIGDGPAGLAQYSCSPVLKQTHPWRQLFSSQMMIAEQQKAHPGKPKRVRWVRDIFQGQERGHRSTFSSLPCSPQGQEAARGQARQPGHFSAQPAPWGQLLGSWLSAAGNPSGGERPRAELQPGPGSEKVTAKPTSHKPSEPAAQTPCQD